MESSHLRTAHLHLLPLRMKNPHLQKMDVATVSRLGFPLIYDGTGTILGVSILREVGVVL